MALSRREKYVLIGGGISFGMMVLYLFILSPIFSKIEKMEREIDIKNKELAEVLEKKSSILRMKNIVETLESQMAPSENFSVASILEELAVKNNIKEIEEIEKKGAPSNDYYKEEIWEISFKEVTLKEVVNLLLAIENYQNLLILKRLSMVTSERDRDKLKKVVIQISAFTRL